MLYKLRVHPGAKKDSLVEKGPDAFEVWVRAPAERGLANRACLELVGARLGVPSGRIRLVKGAKSPSKIVEVP